MKRWPMKSLGEVLEISRERIEPLEHPDRRFNYIGLESIEGHTGNLLPHQPTTGAEIKSTKNVFHPGEILYGKLRPYLNKVHLASAEGICSTDIYVLRSSQQQMHPSFAAYYLRSPSVLSAASNAMAGANLPRIGQDALLAIPAPVPPLTEQERIVKLLDEADELRKLRVQADARTAQLLPALFHQTFAGPKVKTQITALGELVEEFRYGTSNKSTESGKPTLRIPNVVAQSIDLSDLKFVQVTDADFERLRLKDGDLLFVRTNGNIDNVGRCAVFDSQAINAQGFDSSDFVYASYLIRARLRSEAVLPLFLQHFLSGQDGSRQLRNRAKTSAGQFNINTEGLGSIPIPVPKLALQLEFAHRAKEIRELEAAQAASRQRTEDLFQSMLHRAFSGEL